MPSNPDSGFHFRSVELASYFDENYGRDRRSIVSKICLRRYLSLTKASLPALSAKEAVLVWSALNGANTSHADMLPILQQSIASELKDDGHTDLAATVLSWALPQWIAVVDACDRVGQGSYSVENIEAELIRVGFHAPK